MKTAVRKSKTKVWALGIAGVAVVALMTVAAYAADPAPAVMGTKDNTWQTFLLPKSVRDNPPPRGNVTPIAPGDVVGPMARATVCSRDRSRALYLYQNVLGLVSLTDTYWRGLAINRAKGTRGLEQHAVIMMAGNSGEGNIGVYQLYREKFAPPAIKTDGKLRTGDYALTFYTNDIDKVYAGAQDIGFTIILPPTVQPNGEKRLIFRGPDAVIEHFVQRG